MIPPTNTLTQIDELPGEEIEFGIGDPRWVMRTQAELYSDVTTAIIREYSTNAYDANVMAGNPAPIRVTLPSEFNNSMFIVEDDGVGMDINLFRKVYTQFGVSDKRESNDTNGMLGYGSKSGVAYTNAFQVTSVRDGVKIHGVVMRRADWSLVLKVVSSVKTAEHNGTRIEIPVHNIEEFNHKAQEFYKFWLPGRVLVNGKAPEHAVGNLITEGLYYSQAWNRSYVVMGNVPYRIENPDALFRDMKMRSINFVAYVDNYVPADGGAPVEFTPSREDLKYTERTKGTLQAIIQDFETQILTVAQSEIDVSTTHAEAYKAWRKWTDLLGRDLFKDLEFKGDKFKDNFVVAGTRYSFNAGRGGTQTIREWSVQNSPNTMFVTGYDLTVSSAHKAKVKEYAEFKKWDTYGDERQVKYVVFMNASDVDCPWVTKDRFVSWDTIKAELPKKPKAPVAYNSNHPNAGRISGSWDYYTPTEDKYESQIPASAKNLFFITLQNDKRYNVRSVLGALGVADAVVVIVPQNRLKKFLRDYPSVQEFTAYARGQVVKDGESLLSPDAKALLAVSENTRRWVKALNLSKVNDPEITRLHSLVGDEKNLTKEYLRNINLANYAGMGYNGVTKYTPRQTDYMAKTYPLLDHGHYSTPRVTPHVYIYLNAVHAAESENNS